MTTTITDTKAPQTPTLPPIEGEQIDKELALVHNGMGARRYNIPGDLVFKKTADLDERSRSALRWLHDWAHSNDLNYEDIGEKLKRENGKPYDRNTVYKILTGRHEASITNFVESVIALRKFIEDRDAVKRAPFIETSLSKMIINVCEAALLYQKIGFIYGESQIGKTTALEEYARSKKGTVLYVRMPEGGALYYLLSELANVLGFSASGSEKALRKRILDSINGSMLLIVDEITECFVTSGKRPSRVRTINFIREIYDRKKCGVVISGTNLVRDEFKNGLSKKIIDQFRLRGLKPLQLPDKPSAKDLNLFAAHYGLAPASGFSLELQNEVVTRDSLGMWLTYLTAASRIAAKAKTKMTWEHVTRADATFRSMEAVKAA